jgi:hypothetical protein
MDSMELKYQDRAYSGGYYSSNHATFFGGTVPVISLQTVPHRSGLQDSLLGSNRANITRPKK